MLSPRSLTVLLVAAVLGIHLTWITANYSYDAVAFAGLVHRSVYSPHIAMRNAYHMLYMPLNYVAARSLTVLGFEPDILAMMQILNALTTALYLYVFARILTKMTGQVNLSLAVTGVLGFAHFVWYYSTDPEVYPSAVLAMLLAFAATHHALHTRTRRHVALAGALVGLAFASHIATGLLLPGVVTAIMFRDGSDLTRRRRVADGLLLMIAFCLVALSPYLVLYLNIPKSSAGVGVVEVTTSVFGNKRSEGLRAFMDAGFHPLDEIRHLLHRFARDSAHSAYALAAGAAVSRGLLLAMALVVVVRVRETWRRYRWTAFVLLEWQFAFTLFFSSWNLGQDKYMSFQLVPFLMLFGIASSTLPWQRSLPIGTMIGACVLGLTNLFAAIRPDSKLANNREYQKAMFVRDCTRPEDLIIQLGRGENTVQKVYLPHFGARRGLVLDFLFATDEPSTSAILNRLLGRMQGCWAGAGRVFLFSDVLGDTPHLGGFFPSRNLPPDLLRRFFAPYEPTLHATFDDRCSLYLLASPQRPDPLSELSHMPLPAVP